MKLFQSTVRLLPSETGCNKISQQDFAALADADMASQMLVLTFVFRTIWEQLLECDDESTQYDCFVFCLIAPRRFACVVYAMFAFYRHCLHVRQSLENIGKQKKAIHWTHPFPFFKMPKKKHHVASCCCATTIKECLFTWDFETKNLMQSEYYAMRTSGIQVAQSQAGWGKKVASRVWSKFKWIQYTWGPKKLIHQYTGLELTTADVQSGQFKVQFNFHPNPNPTRCKDF